MTSSPIIIALDYPNLDNTLELVDQLDPEQCRLKVGMELYTREGPAVIHALHDRHFQVFLDLKFHDIPNTVGKACASAADMGVWMVNVHASGGAKMLEAARKAVEQVGSGSLLTAVTVLTSMEAEEFREIGGNTSIETQVCYLAKLAEDCGLHGVVCSAREAPLLREQSKPEFLLVTPGIRLDGEERYDQKRVATPAEAVRLGSSYLVIGRPITRALYPLQVLREVLSSL
ncbi:Orotidine 5\'-phosphate decarboxylase [gamma proteobacterium HdN1]|nr:Orotidine 5\'-phosphate decarboxylase [gamma proteobacterium HdN1]